MNNVEKDQHEESIETSKKANYDQSMANEEQSVGAVDYEEMKEAADGKQP